MLNTLKELQQIQRRMAWKMFIEPKVIDNYYSQSNNGAQGTLLNFLHYLQRLIDASELLKAFETARQAAKDSAISVYEPFGEFTLTTIIRSAFGAVQQFSSF